MKDTLLSTWVRLRHCDEGATLVEYGIAITLAVAVGIGGLAALGIAINGELGVATGVMTGN